jgi:DNA-binding NtrC family response regulator
METKPDLSGVSILVMDEQEGYLGEMRRILGGYGAQVHTVRAMHEAQDYFKSGDIRAFLANLNLLDENAGRFIRNYKKSNPGGQLFLVLEPGITVTTDDPAAMMVEDYLQKPVDIPSLGHVLEAGGSHDLMLLDPVVNQSRPYFQFRSPAMLSALANLPRIATSEQTVLISGETGTGKEIISRAIHMMSPRASGPFVAVNCGAIPESLIESELFGHEKGAFTGAGKARKGKFETAHQGTLLLDEIGDMPLELQVRLLRVLEEGHIFRVGGESPIEVDVRVIAASRRELKEEIKEGLFREDLYYRLNILRIHLPLLRDRVEDISFLSVHFMDRAFEEMDVRQPWPKLSSAAIKLLEGLPWRGNVRELRNVMTRVATLLPATSRQVLPQHVLPHIEDYDTSPDISTKGEGVFIPFGSTMARAQELLIENALTHSGGNRTRAAKTLDIGIRTLRRKLNN